MSRADKLKKWVLRLKEKGEPENMTLPLWMVRIYSEDEICQYLVKILKDWGSTERWMV